jgi:uracil-DNA glycosylase family protein
VVNEEPPASAHSSGPAARGTGSARDFLPADHSLPVLREAIKRCQGCGLYAYATQAVFGEGPRDADIVFVGEQPGDREDVAGHPFVGPAGQVFDRALQAAGIDRSKVYVTNIVKHFKWKRTAASGRAPGKRRLHDKPNTYEVTACKPWLEEEIRNVKPKRVVCLGSTAAQRLLGKQFRVTRERGQFFESELAPLITATVHPSSILRATDDASRQQEMADFIRDLERVAIKIEELDEES